MYVQHGLCVFLKWLQILYYKRDVFLSYHSVLAMCSTNIICQQEIPFSLNSVPDVCLLLLVSLLPPVADNAPPTTIHAICAKAKLALEKYDTMILICHYSLGRISVGWRRTWRPHLQPIRVGGHEQ